MKEKNVIESHIFHVMVTFSQMDRVLTNYCLGLRSFGNIFVFYVSGKVLFWGYAEIPNSAHPCLSISKVHPLERENG